MILVAYRHGLRASELVDLRWDQVEFRTATLRVRKVKQGTPSTHPILGDELRALRRLQREQESCHSDQFITKPANGLVSLPSPRKNSEKSRLAHLWHNRRARYDGDVKEARGAMTGPGAA